MSHEKEKPKTVVQEGGIVAVNVINYKGINFVVFSTITKVDIPADAFIQVAVPLDNVLKVLKVKKDKEKKGKVQYIA